MVSVAQIKFVITLNWKNNNKRMPTPFFFFGLLFWELKICNLVKIGTCFIVHLLVRIFSHNFSYVREFKNIVYSYWKIDEIPQKVLIWACLGQVNSGSGSLSKPTLWRFDLSYECKVKIGGRYQMLSFWSHLNQNMPRNSI